jgi:hypothetical protein
MQSNIRRRPLALLALATAGTGLFLYSGCANTYEPPLPGLQEAATPPPPISGGTLLVTKDGDTAVAADSDRDRVWIVDLGERALRHEIELHKGDEPGRVLEDAKGRIFVSLRAAGAIATIDPVEGKVVDRREVCPAPRGMAYDATRDAIHVACAGGELVTLPAAGGAKTREIRLERDLRDVIVDGDRLLISRFRAAEVLVVSAEGLTMRRVSLPPIGTDALDEVFAPSVAYRMIQAPSGGVMIVHQRATNREINIKPQSPGGYAPQPGPCAEGSILPLVHSGLTSLLPGADGELIVDVPHSGSFAHAALPVDVALSPSGQSFAAISAGSQLVLIGDPGKLPPGPPDECGPPDVNAQAVPNHPTSVAFRGDSEIVVFTRDPAGLYFPATGETLPFPGDNQSDFGHNLFHAAPHGTGSLACASCHPEGQQDGLTWNFSPIGARRTQSLGGGILSTAPLHWDGDLGAMGNLMGEVFGRRMGGSVPGPLPLKRFERWIDAIPTIPRSRPVDPGAVERGNVVFHDETVGCATCHAGPKYTDNRTLDVGTGRAMQVPQLMGLADRAPYMHDGCAPTLEDRFGACGGGDAHGKTSHLTAEQVSDLVAYLETL